MAYLELSPLIAALGDRPADFEMDRGWLTHFPSRHSFKFDPIGNVRLYARCDCASLSIRPEQAGELWSEYLSWREAYWRPLEINREFASHFRRPNIMQRLFRRLVARLRMTLLDPALDEPHASHSPGLRRVASSS